jgi:hypothetical protein
MCVVTSRGLVTMMRIASGATATDLLDDTGDDLPVGHEQVVARHPRLARDAGGDDDDI